MSSPPVTPQPKRKCFSASTSKVFYPKIGSFRLLNLLQKRELGIGTQDSYFPDRAFQMKIQDFDRIRSHRFGNPEESCHTAYFLRAGRNALIGAWYVQIKHVFVSVVAQLHYDLSRVVFGKTPYIVSKRTVIDACQLTSDPDCFLSVSFVKKCTGEVQVATGMRRANNQYNIFKYRHPYERPFWCCSGNPFTEKFALGCDREICIYSVTGINEIRATEENIYSLAYNDFGSVLHMGTETGQFYSYDLRSCDVIGRVAVGTNLVDDVLPLSDGNACIVSGVMGKLVKIDLRAHRIVQEFPGHSRRSRKIPMSVNESFGLLSATGADDITRLWCLKSGKFLHQFEAPSTYPARSCLVPD